LSAEEEGGVPEPAAIAGGLGVGDERQTEQDAEEKGDSWGAVLLVEGIAKVCGYVYQGRLSDLAKSVAGHYELGPHLCRAFSPLHVSLLPT
jgi:hypothetical protein